MLRPRPDLAAHGATRIGHKKTAPELHPGRSHNLTYCVNLHQDFDNDARADGLATFTDGEADTLFHGDGLIAQVDFHGDVIAGHAHFCAAHELGTTGYVRGTEVELGAVTGEERRVTAAFFLGENVNFTLELGVGGDALGLAKDLATLDRFLFDAAEEGTDAAF